MSEFTIGDRVRFVGDKISLLYGSSGVVVAITPLGYKVQIDGDTHTNAKYGWGLCGHELEHASPTPPPNTVPVRIAVAVGDDGFWQAEGCSGWTDEQAEKRVDFDSPCRVSFITAHVPLPEQPAEVEGKVE